MKRFWEKVNKDGPDGCWVWKAGVNSAGYGSFWLNGQVRRAHRVVMEWQGYDVEGKFVCHSCDNPRCVNPDHLWLGSQKDNMRDAAQKNRLPTGKNRPSGKLSDEDVNNIHKKYNEGGVTQKELAQKYCVSRGHIANILNGERRTTDTFS